MSASTETGQREHHLAMADVDERFQRFYADRYAATVRLARLLTGDVHLAEDLTQDAFIKVYRYAETSTRQIENPAALLRTTAVNLCRSWHTVTGESNAASLALDDLIGIGGFDTWSADLAAAPLPANVTDVILLGRDGRPTLPLTPNGS